MSQSGFSFAAWSEDALEALVAESNDLTFRLSEDRTVQHVACATGSGLSETENWVGQHFEQIVCEDSQAKIPLLLADNAAAAENEKRWRHLNLTGAAGEGIPLLFKCFRFASTGRDCILLSARDLRPMVNVQRQFQDELQSLQRKLLAFGNDLA